jgi:hypothetical protein
VAAPVVADHLLLVLGDVVEVLHQIVDVGVLVVQTGAFDGTVELVHVGLVVLRVVDLHRLRVDVGLERGVVVGEIGQ